MAQCLTIVVPDQVIDAQNCFEDGRVVAFAAVKTSKVWVDITDPDEWAAAEAAGDVIVYRKVRGSYPPAASTTGPGLGNQQSRINGGNHTMTFFENGLKGNSAHWNALRKANNYKAVFIVGADYDKMFVVDNTVTIDGRSNVEEGLDTDASWQVTVSWSDIDEPEIITPPAGFFTPQAA